MAERFTDEEMGITQPEAAPKRFTDREMGIQAPMSEFQPPKSRPPTLQERSKQVYGFEDLKERGTLLPVGETQGGDFTVATPQFLKDMLESALLPGHVTKGGSYTPEDATRFTLDWLAPATAKAWPDMPQAMTARRLRDVAPSTEQLKAKALTSKVAASGSGVVVNPQAQNRLIARLVEVADAEDVTPGLHDATVSVLKKLGTKAGKSPTVEQLIRQRQLLQDAAGKGSPADKRIVSMMIDELDDFIDNLKPSDLVSGNADDLGKNLGEFRRLWTRAKKSEAIEDAIEAASRTASGFENGIRNEFRKILNNPKRARGFSQEEKKLMERIILGKGANLYKLLGKLGFGLAGNRYLGGMVGTAAGGAVGGPLGAAGVPMLGAGAASAAEAATLRNALTARAAVATGRVPQNPIILRLLENELTKRGAGPVAGTQVKTPEPAEIDQYLVPDFL